MDKDAKIDFHALATALRARRDALLASDGIGGLQHRAVDALGRIASRILASDQGFATEIASLDPCFAATVLSLRALLESCDENSLFFIDSEQARAPIHPPALIMHFIAANTALLAWTSLFRALLIGAASMIRLPSNGEVVRLWTTELLAQLKLADPLLRDLVAPVSWSSDALELTQAAIACADTIVVYGSDDTVAQLQSMTGSEKRFLGYSHRVSLGLILKDADFTAAAREQALDIALFDQQGCLSPQCLFVEGGKESARRFAVELEKALAEIAHLFPIRTPESAARIREATELARFETGISIMRSENLAYTIAVSDFPKFQLSSAPGFVYVKPLYWEQLSVSLARQGLECSLQGASIATNDENAYAREAGRLSSFGIGYFCKPGRLQRPPLAWREDNRDVLRSLF